MTARLVALLLRREEQPLNHVARKSQDNLFSKSNNSLAARECAAKQ